MDADSGCVFCDIVAGRAEATVPYRDDVALAIMDIRPVTPGHLFVVPRDHAPFLADLDEGAGAHLFRVAMRMAGALRTSGLRCEGVNLFLADGEAASQEVFHVHLHVFPRYPGDGFKIDADWTAEPSREDLDAAADRIRQAYRDRYGDPVAGS